LTLEGFKRSDYTLEYILDRNLHPAVLIATRSEAEVRVVDPILHVADVKAIENIVGFKPDLQLPFFFPQTKLLE
jgi:hypothetical protein